jgi:four helix bundle protein
MKERPTKNLNNFFFIAKGSSAEVRSMIHLACSLKYIPDERYKSLHNDAEEISRILSGFIKTL